MDLSAPHAITDKSHLDQLFNFSTTVDWSSVGKQPYSDLLIILYL